ncbi:MAG TPA: hypothetical protein VM118_08950 [Acidobacteriota bacterium]|nr:hypothetical protein [Acidobacteriota bacterium]
MKTLSLMLIVGLAVISPSMAVATSSVVIESKTVPLSATGQTVGVYIVNDATLCAVTMPLVIRSTTSGAFIADTLAFEPLNRLASGLGDMVEIAYLPTEDSLKWWLCDGFGFQLQGAPDFASPDAILYGGFSTSDTFMTAGSDGTPPGGTPSAQFYFNVTGTAGTFEIDTTCISPANHLSLIENVTWERVPVTFTKGVVTIADTCACDCHADPICDSVHNILDLVAIVGVAFQGADPIPDPNAFCPYETTDVNCDNETSVLDVVRMNLVVNYGADPDTTFCDPCEP